MSGNKLSPLSSRTAVRGSSLSRCFSTVCQRRRGRVLGATECCSWERRGMRRTHSCSGFSACFRCVRSPRQPASIDTGAFACARLGSRLRACLLWVHLQSLSMCACAPPQEWNGQRRFTLGALHSTRPAPACDKRCFWVSMCGCARRGSCRLASL